jgi:hypothetical protein
MIAPLTTHQESCSNTTTTLRNPQDASAIASCTTFTGTIAVATDFASPVVEVDGPEMIIGSVMVQNVSNLTTIAAKSLANITNECVLAGLPLLTNITLPQWTSVNSLTLNQIPTPNTLNMQTKFQQVTNLYITNTTLEVLPGLLLQSSQMDNLVITGNDYLNSGYFGVGNITQQATIMGNGGQMVSTRGFEIKEASMADPHPLDHRRSKCRT